MRTLKADTNFFVGQGLSRVFADPEQAPIAEFPSRLRVRRSDLASGILHTCVAAVQSPALLAIVVRS